MDLAFRDILATLEDETSDDISKWRNLCFKQVTRLRASDFMHLQDGLMAVQRRNAINERIASLDEQLKSIRAINVQIESDLSAVTNCENEMSQKLKRMQQTEDAESMIIFRLEQAPKCFLDILRGHQVTHIPEVQDKFRRIDERVGMLSNQISRVQEKIATLIKSVAKRKDDARQAATTRARLENEMQSLSSQISEVQIPVMPSEVVSIASQFENAMEASKRLLAIEREIAELETKMSTVQLDNRPSEVSVLEGLIENENAEGARLLESVVRKYDTEELNEEVQRAGSEVEQLKVAAQKAKDEADERQKQIRETVERSEPDMRQRIVENDDTIRRLRERVAELASQVPLPNHAAHNTTGTQTVYVSPTFF